MNRFFVIFCLLLLGGCVAGDFGADRERLHSMNSDREICEKTPERCINGVSW